ncbi:PREDICTED: gap junction Cx32.2 protein-like [Cyprinodon variegatus]|uniref:gap junction Cx32.2 protein-like n=1 Tax=Cyprinodon variegatus TaxID=28743 RepID=UPI000742949A|nr:PREDICTED: gap junction Cx32.2 protein-like [Cyprinodon variegatus]
MGDWSYLSLLMDKVQAHSTVVGKIWMSVLFIFRIFVLGAAADNVWEDEVSEFYCDTLEPGCEHSCYNWKFPISYIHYWVLQIVLVSTPTLVYLGHAIHVVHKEKRMMDQAKHDGKLKKAKFTDVRGKVRITGILFCTYMSQLVFKILLEVGFSVAQFYILGSVFMVSYFHCEISPPCARFSGAQCYISRPTEKTIFIIFMLVVSGISVLLNIIEMIYLVCKRRRMKRKQRVGRQHPLTSACLPELPAEAINSHCEGFPMLPLPSDSRRRVIDQHYQPSSKEKNT